MTKMMNVKAWVGLLLLCGFAAAQAQSAYPSRPIRLIVPYGAGASADQISRGLAQLLSEKLGQPIVVENKPGASTAIGVNTLTAAPADGYTLLFSSASTITYNPLILKSMTYKVSDLQNVALVADVPLVMLTSVETPVSTVEEFVKHAKANPGKLNFASAGPGTSTHLAVEFLKQVSGVELGPQVPFGGNSQALLSLLRNDTQLLFDAPAPPLQQIKAGKVKVLGVGSKQRLELYKDVPTIAETYPGFSAGLWYGISVQNGVPPEIVNKLRSSIQAVLAMPEFQQKANAWGVQLFGNMTPEALRKYLDDERVLWQGIVSKAKISLD